jgi:hypothetical protein
MEKECLVWKKNWGNKMKLPLFCRGKIHSSNGAKD